MAYGGRRERKPKPFTKERAWNYLLFLLSRRSYTVAELRERLQRRGLPEEEAEPLLERLAELRLVDDALYAEQYVSSRKEARGRILIRQELRRKGVEPELVDSEVEELTPQQQADAATALLEKNAWRYRPPDATEDDAARSEDDAARFARRELVYKARAKAFGFLARRGFAADAASAALERVGWFDDDD